MDSPACGLGYCEDCGIDCGVRDRDDDAAIETLRELLLVDAAHHAMERREGWGADGCERRACIAIALALLL